jgi:hypothetical protein
LMSEAHGGVNPKLTVSLTARLRSVEKLREL